MIQHDLKSSDKVIAICKHLNATVYINSIGARDLYSKDHFKDNGIDLFFLRSENLEYKQFNNDFIPNLSIHDIMMFNPIDKINQMLYSYTLI
jgi:hypothetical protein